MDVWSCSCNLVHMLDVSSWPVVTGMIVPVAAILVSSSVAIWLARAERKSAELVRTAERQLLIKDRQQAKTEDVLERVLGTLAWFISADPGNEDWRLQIRSLRGQVYIVQSLPDDESRAFGAWLASEVERGVSRASQSLDEFGGAQEHLSGDALSTAVATVMDPFRLWVKCTMDLIVIWLRGDRTASEVVIMAENAASVAWDLDQGR